MAKYRGKHQGQTRGKYRKVALVAFQDSKDDLFESQHLLHQYFCDKGIFLSLCQDEGSDYFKETSSTYHLGGATVCMNSIQRFTKGDYNWHYQVDLKIVSNDSLDDVIEKITRDFPHLEPKSFDCF